MRNFTYTTIVALSAALFASAQGVQPPAAVQEDLNKVLGGWEKSMTDLQSFACVVKRTTTDKALGSRDEFKGFAMFMKPQVKDDFSRARLELTKTTNEKVFEKYICTGNKLYEYAPTNQTIRVHPMPNNKQGGMAQESFLSFLFGMGAADALNRYDMKLAYPQDGKPDANYHYIQVVPKMDRDKGEFAYARLSLYRANNLPAQIWYLQANKNEIEWNFSEVQVNVQIPEKWFVPDMIKGWRVENVQPKEAPKIAPVVRQPAK